VTGKGDGVEKPRRFYKTVTVGEADGGHVVLLDGRAPKTPSGRRVILPTPALAALVAADWDAQAVEIDSLRMPAQRLAATAIDRVGGVRDDVADEIARYAGSDLLCYRAESPAGLVEAQSRSWDPMLDWAAEDLGLRLTAVSGIIHSPQPEGALNRVRALALGLDDFGLTALAHATSLFGSAVLALALQRCRLDGREAHDIARLDEAWQEERWGVDYEAADRTAARLEEALLLERWFRALD
jgi:chaperone required for assembly of F1-ATPase